MRNDFCIAGRLEDRAALLQLMTDLWSIDNVAVRCHRKIPVTIFKNKRLSIHQTGIPIRRIADVTDRTIAV
ncbi:hypothetical protein D3C77_469640 [compost metagenome]